MELEQRNQPIFSLPEDLLNLEQSDLLNCFQVLDFFKNPYPYSGLQKLHLAFNDALVFPQLLDTLNYKVREWITGWTQSPSIPNLIKIRSSNLVLYSDISKSCVRQEGLSWGTESLYGCCSARVSWQCHAKNSILKSDKQSDVFALQQSDPVSLTKHPSPLKTKGSHYFKHDSKWTNISKLTNARWPFPRESELMVYKVKTPWVGGL